jgi:copper chaperone CopZ
MQTELLKVTGMSCGGCASKVSKALHAVPGVADIKVSLSSGEVTVQFDEHRASPGELKSAVQGTGFGVDAPNAARSAQSMGCCCR